MHCCRCCMATHHTRAAPDVEQLHAAGQAWQCPTEAVATQADKLQVTQAANGNRDGSCKRSQTDTCIMLGHSIFGSTSAMLLQQDMCSKHTKQLHGAGWCCCQPTYVQQDYSVSVAQAQPAMFMVHAKAILR